MYFEDDFPEITKNEISAVVSLALVGAAIGSLFAGSISDLIGRKKVILMADFVFTVGSIMLMKAGTVYWLMIGRFVVGMGVGIAAIIVPLYLAEVAPVEIRGLAISTNIACITFGQLLSVLLVFKIRPNWRLMLGLGGVPSIIQFFGMLFLPESPRWLSKMGYTDRQLDVMESIYLPEYVN